jgi:hypothetical protein
MFAYKMSMLFCAVHLCPPVETVMLSLIIDFPDFNNSFQNWYIFFMAILYYYIILEKY